MPSTTVIPLATAAAAAGEVLQEFSDCRGVALRVDREKGVIHGVKLLGAVSKKGREYPQAVMARALPMYEGLRVNVDHVDPGQRPQPAGPHRTGQERRAAGRRPVRRLPLQPQARPGRADRLGCGERPAEPGLLARLPRPIAKRRRPHRGRLHRQGLVGGSCGQSSHDQWTV